MLENQFKVYRKPIIVEYYLPGDKKSIPEWIRKALGCT